MIITHANIYLAMLTVAVITAYIIKWFKHENLKTQLEETGKSHRVLVRQLDFAEEQRRKHRDKYLEARMELAQLKAELADDARGNR